MLFIFDKDGTLVRNAANLQKPPNKTEEQEVLPNVLEKLDFLRNKGHKIAIASNQGGVAWGFLTEDQARDLMKDCVKKIGGADGWAVCPHDLRAFGKPNSNQRYAISCNCRKPASGMLDKLMWATDSLSEDTIFVGDQESDKQAAENAGIKFIWAKNFFG